MESPPTKPPDKRLVAIAAVSAAIVWLWVILFIVGFVAVSIFTAVDKHSLQLNFGHAGGLLVFAAYGLFFLCGAAYIAIAFSLHCPHCNFKFLVNPKGFGPRHFVYHPNCPRRWGFNPWAVQIVTFLKTAHIRCINCGKEVFD